MTAIFEISRNKVLLKKKRNILYKYLFALNLYLYSRISIYIHISSKSSIDTYIIPKDKHIPISGDEDLSAPY